MASLIAVQNRSKFLFSQQEIQVLYRKYNIGASRFIQAISARSHRDLCLESVISSELLEIFAPVILELQLMVEELKPVPMAENSCVV